MEDDPAAPKGEPMPFSQLVRIGSKFAIDNGGYRGTQLSCNRQETGRLGHTSRSHQAVTGCTSSDIHNYVTITIR